MSTFSFFISSCLWVLLLYDLGPFKLFFSLKQWPSIYCHSLSKFSSGLGSLFSHAVSLSLLSLHVRVSGIVTCALCLCIGIFSSWLLLGQRCLDLLPALLTLFCEARLLSHQSPCVFWVLLCFCSWRAWQRSGLEGSLSEKIWASVHVHCWGTDMGLNSLSLWGAFRSLPPAGAFIFHRETPSPRLPTSPQMPADTSTTSP